MKFNQRLAIGYLQTKFKFLSSLSKKNAAKAAFKLFRSPQQRTRSVLPKIFTEAEPLKFLFDGISIRGWRWNHPSDRKILIIHGFESSVTNFDRYIRPFIKKGYEVLAFDAPAHGRSGGKMITAPLYSEMIIDIHKKFGPVKSFLAHSFGGLAVCLALEKINHDESSRLALIAPATETRTAIDSFFEFLKLDQGVRKEFEELIKANGGLSSDWYSITRSIRNIRAKVRWYHDEDDQTTPLKDAENLRKENYGNIEFVISKGLGHSRIYKDNKVTRSVIEFL